MRRNWHRARDSDLWAPRDLDAPMVQPWERAPKLGIGIGVGILFGGPVPGFTLASPGGYILDISADFVVQSGTISDFINQVPGLAHNYTQGTATNQPAYEATGWVPDSSPSALFDGADNYVDCLTSLAADLVGGTDNAFSLFVVGQWVALNDNTTMFSFGRTSNDNPFLSLEARATNTTTRFRKRDDAGTLKQPDATTGTGDTNRHVYEFICSGTTITVREDGTAVLTAGDIDVGAMTVDRAGLGALTRIGLANFGNIRFKRMVGYTGALSDADAALVRAALTAEHF